MKKLLTLTALAALGGCAETKVLSTWKEPGVGPLAFHSVLVVAPSSDPSMRRSSEDELVAHIRNARAVPSYTFIPDSELKDEQAVRARAKAAGFDGLVLMRVVSVDREAQWVPGTWSGPYWAYGGYPEGGYMQVTTYARCETNVYSLADDRLVFAAASRTADPGSVRSLVSDTAKAVTSEMQKQGLLPQ
jgi:hypothetical protein